jgi:hypothetical protein
MQEVSVRSIAYWDRCPSAPVLLMLILDYSKSYVPHTPPIPILGRLNHSIPLSSLIS